ncbi:hypothetical protein DH2020_042964 [Rehmannia glutinosa]|uniref:Aldose 1-epimerase n=1 Tax=Rehmannia glutinosa TaxID=99300 RepID=A0ABR0UL50_REHGL
MDPNSPRDPESFFFSKVANEINLSYDETFIKSLNDRTGWPTSGRRSPARMTAAYEPSYTSRGEPSSHPKSQTSPYLYFESSQNSPVLLGCQKSTLDQPYMWMIEPTNRNDSTYFGALVGRVANRIGGAQFTLNGHVYKLPANDHGNTLHGGSRGFGDVVWTVYEYVKESHLTLTYDSHDGEQGFPGELSVRVTYLLIGRNKFGIKMEANPKNKPTPVNLASHTYWNLGGHTSGNILYSHTIQLFASRITPVNDNLIPTGEISPVGGTAYDFLEPRTIASKFNELPDGYDINYVLDRTGAGKTFTKAATVRDGKSGRKMELWTDQAGVQFYTSNMLGDTVGKGGFVYKKYGGFCLETQGFPDSVNHRNFPSQIILD